MTKTEIFEELKIIIQKNTDKLMVNSEALKLDDEIISVGINSIDLIRIIVVCEQEFKVQDMEINEYHLINDLVNYIHTSITEKTD